MHLPLPWSAPADHPTPLPELARSIGTVEYRTAGSELLAWGRGPVRGEDASRIEVDPFPDRFDATYGRRYQWHLLRDGEGRYFLVVNRRDIKPVGVLEAACRWVSAAHVIGARPDSILGLRGRA